MYDGKQIQEIEQIQLKFLKRMLGVRRQTHIWLSTDTGQFPKIDLQQISVLKYWCHILSLPPESVVRRAYNMLIQLYRLGKQNKLVVTRKIIVDWNSSFRLL